MTLHQQLTTELMEPMTINPVVSIPLKVRRLSKELIILARQIRPKNIPKKSAFFWWWHRKETGIHLIFARFKNMSDSKNDEEKQPPKSKDEKIENHNENGGGSSSSSDSESAEKESPPSQTELNYAITKKSEEFNKAKAQLTKGDFDEALETIETALKTTMSLLPDIDELHESLAPLYYLYGTTLLYTVEETDNPEANVMIPEQQQQNQKNHQEKPGEGENQASSSTPPLDESAGDLQIAWENLESAKSILSRITTPTDIARATATKDSKSPGDEEIRDRVLDLAQIHVRLGDIQRANGNYMGASDDYQTALDLRKPLLGHFDRKVADVYYSLAMTQILAAAEGERALQQQQKSPQKTSPKAPAVTPEQVTTWRTQSIGHYLSCAKALVGVIGKLCNVDPNKIILSQDNDISMKGEGETLTKKDPPPSEPSDTTNKKPEPSSLISETSKSLSEMRKRVSPLQPVDIVQHKDVVHNIKEMLDEIQETIDTSEEDKVGLQNVSEMKAKAEADVEAQENNLSIEAKEEADKKPEAKKKQASVPMTPQEPLLGPTTTIGFGPTNGTKSNKSSSTPSPKNVENPESKPVMIVKKKAKKRAVLQPVSTENNKRVKTE